MGFFASGGMSEHRVLDCIHGLPEASTVAGLHAHLPTKSQKKGESPSRCVTAASAIIATAPVQYILYSLDHCVRHQDRHPMSAIDVDNIDIAVSCEHSTASVARLCHSRNSHCGPGQRSIRFRSQSVQFYQQPVTQPINRDRIARRHAFRHLSYRDRCF